MYLEKSERPIFWNGGCRNDFSLQEDTENILIHSHLDPFDSEVNTSICLVMEK